MPVRAVLGIVSSGDPTVVARSYVGWARHHGGVDASGKARWGGDLTASLVGARKPGEVFQAAALCLAEEFAPDGFRWVKSRRSLERHDGAGRWERIRLETSYRNRAGEFVRFAVAGLVVEDAVLGDWRDANHPRTVVRADGLVGILCATSCLDPCWAGFQNELNLTRPEVRVARVGALCDQIRESVLPWFAATRDPATLAATVPDELLGPFAFAMDLVEFLVSRGEREQARLLIKRVLATEPRQRAAFGEGRALACAGERPSWHTPVALGWCSAVLGLL